jgi:hypothetical protein
MVDHTPTGSTSVSSLIDVVVELSRGLPSEIRGRLAAGASSSSDGAVFLFWPCWVDGSVGLLIAFQFDIRNVILLPSATCLPTSFSGAVLPSGLGGPCEPSCEKLPPVSVGGLVVTEVSGVSVASFALLSVMLEGDWLSGLEEAVCLLRLLFPLPLPDIFRDLGIALLFSWFFDFFSFMGYV